MRIASITIARGGSTRLPDKNMHLFFGRPLVAHKVWQLSKCPSIDQIVVGSDSAAILEEARAQGATIMPRAPEYCDEVSRPWNDVIVDMVERVEADVIVWAHCTNPCINPATYERAIAHFKALGVFQDSIVSVSELRGHLWWRDRPLTFPPYLYARDRAEPHVVAAAVEPVYYQNGGIFIATREDILRWRYVYGPHAKLLVIDRDEATDIDTAEDMARAHQVYERMRASQLLAA